MHVIIRVTGWKIAFSIVGIPLGRRFFSQYFYYRASVYTSMLLSRKPSCRYKLYMCKKYVGFNVIFKS